MENSFSEGSSGMSFASDFSVPATMQSGYKALVESAEGNNKMDYQKEYFDNIKSKIDSFTAEMRDRDNQRHNEIIAMENRLNTSIEANTSRLFSDLQNRDDQRHQEIIAMELRTNQSIQSAKNEAVATRRWIMGIFFTLTISLILLLIKLFFFSK